MHTDTLTIITKKAEDASEKKVEKQNITGEMLQVLNLKPMKIKKEAGQTKAIGGHEIEKKQKIS